MTDVLYICDRLLCYSVDTCFFLHAFVSWSNIHRNVLGSRAKCQIDWRRDLLRTRCQILSLLSQIVL
jgi:hypothetical protein